MGKPCQEPEFPSSSVAQSKSSLNIECRTKCALSKKLLGGTRVSVSEFASGCKRTCKLLMLAIDKSFVTCDFVHRQGTICPMTS